MCQLRLAAAVLDELARAHKHAWSQPATREALAVVGAWLLRVARPSERARPGERCECGAALAHVGGAGVEAVLCPTCDADSLDALAGCPDLNDQLTALGKEAARDAWVEHAGALDVIPSTPELRAWARAAYARGLLESDRAFADSERRVFVHAYRNELHVLAARAG